VGVLDELTITEVVEEGLPVGVLDEEGVPVAVTEVVGETVGVLEIHTPWLSMLQSPQEVHQDGIGQVKKLSRKSVA
jgi:hypothetical protein